MNYLAQFACRYPRMEPWQYYCRWLEADDVRGLVARYGGTPRFHTGPRVCTRGPAPAPVEALAATTSRDAFTTSATLTWTNPQSTSATGVGVLFKVGSCPTGPADTDAFGRHELSHVPGPASVTQSQLPLGTICALVQAFDRWGQPSPAATTTFVNE